MVKNIPSIAESNYKFQTNGMKINNPGGSAVSQSDKNNLNNESKSYLTHEKKILNWAFARTRLFPKNFTPRFSTPIPSSTLTTCHPNVFSINSRLVSSDLIKQTNIPTCKNENTGPFKIKSTSAHMLQEHLIKNEVKIDNTIPHSERINAEPNKLLIALQKISSDFKNTCVSFGNSLDRLKNSIFDLFLSKDQLQTKLLKRRLSDATEKFNFKNMYKSDPLQAREYARNYLAYRIQDEVNSFLKNRKNIMHSELDTYYKNVVNIARNAGIEADITYFGSDGIYLDLKAPQGKPEITLMREIAEKYDGEKINILHPEMKSLNGYMINLAKNEFETLTNKVNADVDGIYSDKPVYDHDITIYEMRKIQGEFN
jgi:hypothetical protein